MLITLIIAIIIVILIVAVLIARRRNKSKAPGAVDSGEANKQVYVGNLSYQVSEQDLKDYFGKYGTIEQVRVVRNYSSGRSKGFGFVTYRTPADAKNALVAHGQKYKDRTIVVRIAKPR